MSAAFDTVDHANLLDCLTQRFTISGTDRLEVYYFRATQVICLLRDRLVLPSKHSMCSLRTHDCKLWYSTGVSSQAIAMHLLLELNH